MLRQKFPFRLPQRFVQQIAAGVEVNARNETGSSPLIMAASFATDPNIITELLDAGADLNAKDWLTGSVLANESCESGC